MKSTFGSWLTAARNAVFFAISFPLRESFVLIFSIELVSTFFSVFSALLPTVSFGVVDSTTGVSFFSTGLFLSFELTETTNFWYALVNSSCVVALSKVAFAEFKSTIKLAILSSVLFTYAPLEIFPSISPMKFDSCVLSNVFTVSFADSCSVSFTPNFVATPAATSSFVASLTTDFTSIFSETGLSTVTPSFFELSIIVFFDTSSLACATAPAPKKILAPITTDAVPTLNFLIA